MGSGEIAAQSEPDWRGGEFFAKATAQDPHKSHENLPNSDEDEVLDQLDCNADPARGDMREADQFAEQLEIAVRGEQQVDDAARREPLARLVEQRRHVAISRPGMPAAICQVARLAGVFGRAGQDHVEQRAGRECREQVARDAGDAVAQPVGAGILGGRDRGVGIDVGRKHIGSAGPRCRQRQDARTGADVDDGLAGEIEPVDELREALAGDEEARVKNRRAYAEAKARRPREPSALPAEDQVVRKK